MGEHGPSFATMLDHLAGRESPAAARYLASSPQAAETAVRLLAAMRGAGAAPRLTGSLRRRALRVFRERQHAPGVDWLRLVFDSLLSPAPALRRRRTAAPESRFVRLVGDRLTVELQFSRRRGRIELRGQLTPAVGIREVRALAAGRTSKVRVEQDGTFVFASLGRGETRLEFGDDAVASIEL